MVDDDESVRDALDIRLPGLSGLDLQRQLANVDRALPIIFITAHGDIRMSVQAMKSGAVEFLTKPFRNQELLNAVQRALDRSRHRLRAKGELAGLLDRYKSLTNREKEVIALVVRGMLNKQIAGQMDITEATVKLHRARVMQKMHATSLAELVRMNDKIRNVTGASGTSGPSE